jgi:hypothetical protein
MNGSDLHRPEVDLVVLSRSHGSLPPAVERGIAAQRGVRLHVYRIVGEPQPDDHCRWATIARARNAAKRLGTSRLVMYLDDDVVLAPDCIAKLAAGLARRRGFAALAADYLRESARQRFTVHVAMGATLFRRHTLAQIQFRWQNGRCECQCCCDDLRERGRAIAYLPEARAWHLKSKVERHIEHRSDKAVDAQSEDRNLAGRVLAAFDRRHLHRFCRRFLTTFRAAGNEETVTAVTYGLFPSEVRRLRRMPAVEVLPIPGNGVVPAIRRLRDFQDAIARWPEETPVAYWDAGDVVFQSRLDTLWPIVRKNPDKLLAVREPFCHPENTAVARWTLSIRDTQARQTAFDLLSSRPFLNAGFAAGTAGTMLTYLRAADGLLHSPALQGTLDWGDQTAMNLYCHSNPDSWLEVEEGWNYCLCGRKVCDVTRVGQEGVSSTKGVPVHVVHGNAGSIRRLAIYDHPLVQLASL